MLLKDKNIIITGCFRGIGKKTLEMCASQGANVFAFSEQTSLEFEGFIQQLSEKYNVEITPLIVNFFEENEIKNAFKEIIKKKIPVHGLINIAGITQNSLLNMTTIQEMRKVFDINFFAQMLVIQYTVKLMTKYQIRGSIVNIASVSALDGNRGQVAYSASKAAMIGVTKTLAIELGENGIRVNAVAPGVIDTDMTASLNKEDYEMLVGKTNIGRAGTQEEVANTLVYLCSDLSSYVTGQIIRIDGGM